MTDLKIQGKELNFVTFYLTKDKETNSEVRFKLKWTSTVTRKIPPVISNIHLTVPQ